MGFASMFSGGAGGDWTAPGNSQEVINGQQANLNATVAQQQAIANAMAAQNGISNQSNVFAQQQALAGQMGGPSDRRSRKDL